MTSTPGYIGRNKGINRQSRDSKRLSLIRRDGASCSGRQTNTSKLWFESPPSHGVVLSGKWLGLHAGVVSVAGVDAVADVTDVAE